MNLGRLWTLVRKDFVTGPRKSFFIWALVLPVAMTLIFQVIFGSLFEPKPRLGIVDMGQSEITAAVEDMEGIQLSLLDSIEVLKRQVRDNDLDAGLVLPAGFDQSVRDGQRPQLEFYIGGKSLASNRIILTVTAIDLLRQVERRDPPIEVQMVLLGEEGLPMSIRIIPVLVFYALVMAGVFVPGSNLVEEKERGTFNALLTTPVQPQELLASKWLMGMIFSGAMAALTLFLNGAIGPRPFDVLVVIAVASSLCAMLGLLVGSISRTSTTLFAIVKGMGIFLFAPVFFYLFPDWPQWIARLFPLYWIIEPVWQVSIMGQPVSQVGFELTVAVAITLAMMIPVAVLSRRMHA